MFLRLNDIYIYIYTAGLSKGGELYRYIVAALYIYTPYAVSQSPFSKLNILLSAKHRCRYTAPLTPVPLSAFTAAAACAV